MASRLTEQEIRKAYQNVFGSEPQKSELNEIMQTSDYWGDNARDVAEKLMETPRFQEQPKDEGTIKRTFSLFLGREPKPSEIEEIKNDNEYWGSSAQSLVDSMKRTQGYHRDPSLKIKDIEVPQGTQRGTNMPDVSSSPQTREQKLQRDLKSIGLDDEDIRDLNTEEKEFLGTVGSKMLKNVEEGNPAPTTFTADTFQELYDQAMEDEDIKRYYDGVRTRVKDDFLSSVAQAQEDLDFQTRQNAREFQSEEDRLISELEESGQLYSNTRKEAEKRLRNRRRDVIGSTRSQARRQMTELTRDLQNRIGTDRTEDVMKRLKINRDTLDNVEGLSSQIRNDILNRDTNISGEPFRDEVSEEESELGQQQFQDQAQQYTQSLNELNTLANPDNTNNR